MRDKYYKDLQDRTDTAKIQGDKELYAKQKQIELLEKVLKYVKTAIMREEVEKWLEQELKKLSSAEETLERNGKRLKK